MTQRTPDPDTARSRRLACARCGRVFSCDLSGNCWCAAEDVRLPLPASGDCLCQKCLREAAATEA